MFYQIDLIVSLPASLIRPCQFHKQLHGFLLHAIKEVSEQLSLAIHDEQERQRMSIAVSKNMIKIVTDEKQVFDALQAYFQKNNSIKTPSFSGKVKDVTYKQEHMHCSQKDHYRKVKITFQSPTTFAQYGKYYPIPELQRIFSSALKVYNRNCNTKEITSWEEMKDLTNKMIIGKVFIKTEPVIFKKFTINAFLGYIELDLKLLSTEEFQLIDNLLLCMEYMGIGSKTAMGLGNIIVQRR